MSRRSFVAKVSWGEALAGIAGSAAELERGLLHDHRRDPRDHDLALSVLLAGRRRRPRTSASIPTQAAADRGSRSRRAERVSAHPARHHHRHGVLQPDRAGDHRHRGGDAARAGITDIETSAQAAEALQPIAGAFAEVIFALGIIGTGLLAIPVLAGLGGLRGRRGAALAGRPRAQAEGSGGILRRAGAVGGHRHRAELHADQSDLGAVLERRDQWRPRGAGDGGDDAAWRAGRT